MASITDKMRIIYGDVTLGIKGEAFHYIFSYAKGGLESLVKGGKEWLYREPKPTFWRATTDNDRGNGYSFDSGMWLGADLFSRCTGCKVIIDGQEIEQPIAPVNNQYSNEEQAGQAEIVFRYETCTVPAARVDISYLVSADGGIKVTMNYHGRPGLPSLPLFGMRFVMPTAAVGYEYDGLSGETYPDRMAGGRKGVYRVEGLPVTPYLVPQDCQVHMETKWLRVERNTTLNNADRGREKFNLEFAADSRPFAFSCLPYTAEELENAGHQEELPPVRRTVVSILAAVRGVGGIDSWGSVPEADYQIDSGKDIGLSFWIR